MALKQVWEKYSATACALDSRSLSLLRIGLGVTILLGLWLRLPDFVAHYTEAGVMPLEILRSELGNRGLWTLYTLSPATWWAGFLFALTAVCAVSFTAGWAWRPVGILLWVLMVSLHNRNVLILNSGDHLLLATLFWSLFLPLGLHWRIPIPWSRSVSPPSPPRQSIGIPSLAIILQFILLYSISVLHKTAEEWRSEFSAVWYSLQLPSFTLPPGEFLGSFPQLSILMTPVVFWAEFLVPLLLLIPWKNAIWRMGAFAFGIGIQVGFAITMSLGLFPLAGICLALPLLPKAFWDRLPQRRSGKSPPIEESAPPPLRPTAVQSGLCAAALVFVFFSNLESLPDSQTGKVSRIMEYVEFTWIDTPASTTAKVLPRTTRQVGNFFRLHQNWKMFSPRPRRVDGTVEIEAVLADGSRIDLMPFLRMVDHPDVDLSEPAPMGPLLGYHTPRWRKFFSHVTMLRKRYLVPRLVESLTDRWNAAKPPEQHIVSVTVFTDFFRNWWGKEPERLGRTEIYPNPPSLQEIQQRARSDRYRPLADSEDQE